MYRGLLKNYFHRHFDRNGEILRNVQHDRQRSPRFFSAGSNTPISAVVTGSGL